MEKKERKRGGIGRVGEGRGGVWCGEEGR